MTVVGVMPPGVQHPGNEYHALADGDTVDLWLPFPYEGNPNRRGSHFMEGIARLKAGVSPEQASADMSAVCADDERARARAGGFSWFRCIAKWWGDRSACCWCCWGRWDCCS